MFTVLSTQTRIWFPNCSQTIWFACVYQLFTHGHFSHLVTSSRTALLMRQFAIVLHYHFTLHVCTTLKPAIHLSSNWREHETENSHFFSKYFKILSKFAGVKFRKVSVFSVNLFKYLILHLLCLFLPNNILIPLRKFSKFIQHFPKTIIKFFQNNPKKFPKYPLTFSKIYFFSEIFSLELIRNDSWTIREISYKMFLKLAKFLLDSPKNLYIFSKYRGNILNVSEKVFHSFLKIF